MHLNEPQLHNHHIASIEFHQVATLSVWSKRSWRNCQSFLDQSMKINGISYTQNLQITTSIDKHIDN